VLFRSWKQLMSTSIDFYRERRKRRVDYIRRKKSSTISSIPTIVSVNVREDDRTLVHLEKKKEDRRLRNRESALASRNKKNDEIEKLKRQVFILKWRLSKYETVQLDESDISHVMTQRNETQKSQLQTFIGSAFR